MSKYNVVINGVNSTHKRNKTLAQVKDISTEHRGAQISVYPQICNASYHLYVTTNTVYVDYVPPCGDTQRVATFDKPTNWLAIRKMTSEGNEILQALLHPYMNES